METTPSRVSRPVARVPHALLALLLLAFAMPALAAPSLSGAWLLDEDRSDDPRKALKGLRLMRETAVDKVAQDERRAGADTHYYAQRELLEKRRVEGAVVDVGPLQRVIYAARLDIDEAATQTTVRYDDAWSRTLTPTEGGPVYSAKGGEYKPDSLGLELSYRRDGILFIETVLKPRGRMLEEFEIDSSGRVLTVRTTIDNPDWIIEARLKRVFTRGGAP